MATFGVAKSWQILREPNVRAQNLQLKLKGRLKPFGAVVLLLLFFFNVLRYKNKSLEAAKGLLKTENVTDEVLYTYYATQKENREGVWR